MRLPRNVSGGDSLIHKLEKLGYSPTRQTGSHDRVSFNVVEESRLGFR